MTGRNVDEWWRRVLTGTDSRVTRFSRVMRRVPSAPRCKLCAAPFGRPGATFLRLVGKRRSKTHPMMCSLCARGIDKQAGGAEITLSILFADVRGSTGLAEAIGATEYGSLLNRFYETTAHAVDIEGGLLDRFVGDGVVALFIPGLTGEDHSARAIAAGRRLLRAMHEPGEDRLWLPVGAGVHTGVAYTGVVGIPESGMLDFTAIGDATNVAARLASQAGPGELLVSDAAAADGGLDDDSFPRRHLRLEGRVQEVDVVVIDEPAR